MTTPCLKRSWQPAVRSNYRLITHPLNDAGSFQRHDCSTLAAHLSAAVAHRADGKLGPQALGGHDDGATLEGMYLAGCPAHAVCAAGDAHADRVARHRARAQSRVTRSACRSE